MQKADEDYYLTATYILKLANRAPEIFESSEPEVKRQILKIVLQNCVVNDAALVPTIRNPFGLFAKGASRTKWLPRVGSLTLLRKKLQALGGFRPSKFFFRMVPSSQEVPAGGGLVRIFDSAKARDSFRLWRINVTVIPLGFKTEMKKTKDTSNPTYSISTGYIWEISRSTKTPLPPILSIYFSKKMFVISFTSVH